MPRIRSLAKLVVLGLSFALDAGCRDSGPPTARVGGTVTLGGMPIPANAEALITFRSTTAGQANSASSRIIDGKFDVLHAPRGHVRIEFSIQLPTGEEAFAPGVRPEMQFQSLVPDQYQGGVPIEVTGDMLDMKFDL